ncbi:MAG: shikimate kinase [Lachnospiraceae bacterium]|nr:shikimate kinase [Lachnospiraceae bacterium]
MKNIILIGFMGCGKTSVGGKLARAFGFRFLDTDQLLEEEFGCTISEFFDREGEAEFRRRETQLLVRLKSEPEGIILSTGGGMPLQSENAELLRQLGTVFYLKASEEATLARLEGDTTRPLLAGPGREERIRRLMGERMPKYTAASDHIIETDGKSFYEIIHEVEKVMRRKK